jgi:hypothetical protein
MAITNHERVGKALKLLKSGLAPFVEREIKAVFGAKWIETVKAADGGPGLATTANILVEELDCAALMKVMWECWHDVFGKTLGHAERSLVSELREARNKWAHQKPFSTDDAYRTLDSIHRLLIYVSASKEAEELDRQKTELLRLKFDEQARHEKRKTASTAIESQAVAGLKPWREVVTPHPDVASGR